MQTSLRRILYIDALAGAGKTYAIVRLAHQMVQRRGAKVLIVQPSRLLITRTVRDELRHLVPIRHRVIHGETNKAVIAEIVRHLNAADDEPELLFITQAAFFALPFFANRDRWTVIFDEVPQVTGFEEFNLPDNHALLFPHLRVEDEDGRYGLVTPRDETGRAALARIAKNEGKDDLFAVLSDFGGRVSSPDWEVHILNKQFAAIEKGTLKRLQAFSILQPSCLDGFKSVVIAGACFKDTLLYRLWEGGDVHFEPMALPLRYETHTCGERLTIKYVTEEPWSKAIRDGAANEACPASVASHVRQRILTEVGEEPFLWMGNTDVPDDFFESEGATRLPNSPHGLNAFQDRHTTVSYSALNPSSSQFAFLASRGVDCEEVRTALYRQATYQAVMRSSLRNPADENPKRVIVMDRDTALWLAEKFPGAKVEPLAGEPLAPVRKSPGRRRIHQSDHDRKAAHRRTREQELLVEQGHINADDLAPHLGSISIFASKFDREPIDCLTYDGDDDLVAGLRNLHIRTVSSKEDAGLLSPAFFDPSLSDETARGSANIKHLRGLWLDNDGGHLSHKEFAQLFPSLRVVVFNTHSSTPEKPRWRAFIPTTAALSLKVYRLILGQILADLNREGFWSAEELQKNAAIRRRQTHGFDMSKLTGASLFYLPSQAAHPHGSFFHDYNGERRAALNPIKWIKRAVRTEKVAPAARQPLFAQRPNRLRAVPGQSRMDLITAAEQKWTKANQQVGQGHLAFFRLALNLRRAGLDSAELSEKLYDYAVWARHPSERRSEIPAIVRKLGRSKDRST